MEPDGDSTESGLGDVGGGENIGYVRDARGTFTAEPVADLDDAASDLSSFPELVSIIESDVRGLSVFPLPGIFERMEPRKERVDSFVSDLLKDGYDWRSREVRSDASPVGVFDPSRDAFEACCPMIFVYAVN